MTTTDRAIDGGRRLWRGAARNTIPLVLALLLVVPGASYTAWAQAAHRDANRAPESDYHYNTDYIFAVTRSLQDSAPSPPVVMVASPVTLALDLAFLPFALVLGLFG